MRRRREVEVFSLSFLDCICCGFGAIILLMVLTAVGKPAVLEESRKHMGGEVRLLEEQLNIIRGETDELNRELVGSRETLERERGKLSSLAGDFSRIRGRYAGSREDASVTNIIERQLVTAQQTLSEEMQRLVTRRAQSPRSAAIGGIPIDSDYVIFIIDTSPSMTSDHWDVNLAIVDEILSLYPHVQGLQVLNDLGTYMYEGTRGRWLADTPEQRQEIRARAKKWRAFSMSNPVPGMVEAVRRYWAPDKRIAVFVLGDEFTGDSIQQALDSIGALNKPGPDGRRPIRIHAIGFPEGPEFPPFTNMRFSALMRSICEQNDGTFVGMKH
ncbi:MAG: VWA domain-containing protein [Gammaproteobacteria bacterium]|nr:MAG: VWA domain-containing protein [Gammaproteobacteria bacterium]